MNKIINNTVVALLTMCISNNAVSAFVLNGTRYIFDEEKKNISFEVTNNAEQTYGGQVWVDNTNQSKEDVFIVPAPNFFKVNPQQKQIVRLLNVNPALPKDKESLFWLNVQEIPPKPAVSEGSVLAIALNTQVKLIYRPSTLKDGRINAEKRVQISRRGGVVLLKNPTPYYLAVVEVKQAGKKVTITPEQGVALAQFAPFAEVSLGNITLEGPLSIDAINDWGGVENYEIK